MFRSKPFAVDLIWCGAAVLAVLLLEGAYRLGSSVPLGLFGDHVFLLAPAKLMMEGQGFWRSDMIGYPLGQDSAYWPGFEPSLKLLLLALAHTGLGVFDVVKAFYVVGIALMAASAFCCLRKLNIAQWMSAVGAVAFVVAPYFAIRSVNHDFLSIYIAAAFGATMAIMICQARDADEFRTIVRSKFFLLGLFIITTSGLYYAFFSMLLIGSATVTFSARARNLASLFVLAGISALMLVGLLIGGLGPSVFSFLALAPRRMPVEQFYHGLSISDAIYTLDWLPGARRHIDAYNSIRPATLIGEGAAEWPGTPLTTIIIAAPLLVLYGINTEIRDKSIVGMTAAAALICICVIFASRGGVGYLFNEFITPALRGQTRIMPFLMFLAIFIASAGVDCVFRTGPLPAKMVAALVPLALLVCAYGSSMELSKKQQRVANDKVSQDAIRSFRAMLDAKDKEGLTTILQLPIASWPEVPPRNGFDFYTHHFAFIFDRRESKTRWSYGSSRLQPGFPELRAAIRVESDPAGAAFRARTAGFDGILLEKGPFDPAELSSVISGIEGSLPPDCKLYEDRARVLFDVGANPHCEPQSGESTVPLIVSFRGQGGEFLAGGFDASNPDGTWCIGSDALFVPIPVGAGDLHVTVNFDLFHTTAQQKRLSISINGHRPFDFDVDLSTTPAGKAVTMDVPESWLTDKTQMKVGLHLDGPEGPSPLGSGDPRLLAVFLKTIEMTRSSAKL
jgi:hypothetical protein